MSVTQTDPRVKLREIEGELTSAKETQAVLKRDFERAKSAFVKSKDNDPNSAVSKRAVRAHEELAESTKRVEELRDVQNAALRMFADSPLNRGGSGRNGPALDGIGDNPWRYAAEQISDLSAGVSRVEMPAADLLRRSGPMAAGFNVSPSSGWTGPSYLEEGIAAKGRDERHIYETLPQVRVEQGDLALTEFTQTGSRTVSGEVVRDPLATSEKAALELSLALATPSLEMFAVVVSEVPSQLFTSIDALSGFLQEEMAYQIRVALDAHVIAQITAATPPHSKSGTDLISRCATRWRQHEPSVPSRACWR